MCIRDRYTWIWHERAAINACLLQLPVRNALVLKQTAKKDTLIIARTISVTTISAATEIITIEDIDEFLAMYQFYYTLTLSCDHSECFAGHANFPVRSV